MSRRGRLASGWRRGRSLGTSGGLLLAPGMGFGAFREQIVRPGFLAPTRLWRTLLIVPGGTRRRIRSRSALRRVAPIFWRIGDPPSISMGIERGANQKILSIVS